MRRLLGLPVEVFGAEIHIYHDGEPYACDVVKAPPTVDEFVGNFDKGRQVAPFAFDVEIPGEEVAT